MSSFHDIGAGSPAAWNSGPWTPFADTGAGDPISYGDFPSDILLATGAGDPLTIDDIVNDFTIIEIPPWEDGETVYPPGDGGGNPTDGPIPGPTSQSDTDVLRKPDKNWLPWEGGVVLMITRTTEDKTEPLNEYPYKIRMMDTTGQTHPLFEDGCYSGVQGQGAEILPEPDQLSLVFVTPPLQQGVYRIEVTNKFNQSAVIPLDLLVVMGLDNTEVEALRKGLPSTVYYGAWPDKEYPDG